jgi:hypothetical protein
VVEGEGGVELMKTSDSRPWWWWINPWLYIKRRDIAYDVALDIIHDFSVDTWRPNDNPAGR